MKTLLTSLFIITITLITVAQEKPQKVIFDITSTDTTAHQAMMNMMQVMATDYPNSEFEVMVYGKALTMLMKDRSTVADEIALYANNNKVSFTACEVSMRLIFNIDKTQLLESVGTVRNAVTAIVAKQQVGWGYIKVGI